MVTFCHRNIQFNTSYVEIQSRFSDKTFGRPLSLRPPLTANGFAVFCGGVPPAVPLGAVAELHITKKNLMKFVKEV